MVCKSRETNQWKGLISSIFLLLYKTLQHFLNYCMHRKTLLSSRWSPLLINLNPFCSSHRIPISSVHSRIHCMGTVELLVFHLGLVLSSRGNWATTMMWPIICYSVCDWARGSTIFCMTASDTYSRDWSPQESCKLLKLSRFHRSIPVLLPLKSPDPPFLCTIMEAIHAGLFGSGNETSSC